MADTAESAVSSNSSCSTSSTAFTSSTRRAVRSAASSNCSLLQCGLHARYDHSKSSSWVDDGRAFDIRYVSGPVSGWLESDVVNVGGLTTRTTFAEIDNPSGLGPAFLLGSFDGILGMGL